MTMETGVILTKIVLATTALLPIIFLIIFQLIDDPNQPLAEGPVKEVPFWL